MTFRRHGLTTQIIDDVRGITGTKRYAGENKIKLIIEHRDGRIGTIGYSTEKGFPTATPIIVKPDRIYVLTGSFVSYFEDLLSRDFYKNSEEVLYVFKMITEYYKIMYDYPPPIISTDYTEALENKNRRVPLYFEIPSNDDLAVMQF